MKSRSFPAATNTCKMHAPTLAIAPRGAMARTASTWSMVLPASLVFSAACERGVAADHSASSKHPATVASAASATSGAAAAAGAATSPDSLGSAHPDHAHDEASRERELLARTWTHAHERDAAGELVLVADSVTLPRARYRDRITLRADGSASFSCLSARDAHAVVTGTWSLAAHVLTLTAAGAEKSGANAGAGAGASDSSTCEAAMIGAYRIQSIDAQSMHLAPLSR